MIDLQVQPTLTNTPKQQTTTNPCLISLEFFLFTFYYLWTFGQYFVAPFNPQEYQATSYSSSSWKDDWTACTWYGACHSSFMNALCCPLILLAQVMTRLKLDWRGESAPARDWVKTFPMFVYITTIGYFIVSTIFAPVDYDVTAMVMW